LKLYLVYKRFKDLFNAGNITFKTLDIIQKSFLDNISEREREDISKKQTKIIQGEIDVFDEIVGDNLDAVDTLLQKCLLSDTNEAIDSAKDIMNFYTKVKEVMDQQF
jgi:hypothetical protein